jgi:hypothetical protein
VVEACDQGTAEKAVGPGDQGTSAVQAGGIRTLAHTSEEPSLQRGAEGGGPRGQRSE